MAPCLCASARQQRARRVRFRRLSTLIWRVRWVSGTHIPQYSADLMNKHRRLLRVLVLIPGLLAASAALCAFNPQSYLDGKPQTKTDVQLYSVLIVGIDGEKPHENPVAITPGPHWLEIQAAPGEGSKRTSKSQTFVLKIEPCTRYYLGAHKDSPLLDKWKLVVDLVETIKGCDPADELKKFPDPSLPAAPKSPPAH